MDAQRLAASLLIAGLAVWVVAALLSPPGKYQEPDPQKRVQIIEGYKTRWNISQPLLGLGALLTAVGFAVLALHLGTLANGWVPGLGAVAFALGTVSGAIFLYRQTVDPLGSYEGAYSGMETLYYWLALLGLLLFGVAFLQASLPAWLGYLTAGAALLFGIVFLVSGSGFITPGVVSILSLVIAIFLLRH
jgi:hypothetical protein